MQLLKHRSTSEYERNQHKTTRRFRMFFNSEKVDAQRSGRVPLSRTLPPLITRRTRHTVTPLTLNFSVACKWSHDVRTLLAAAEYF